MKLSFHGANRDVTGSCHLVECAGTRILIDCGLYQGERELDEDNAQPFGFEPEDVDFVLLTHAHLDHCGRIPLLVKRGFRGEIITTAASRELAKLVMLDAARLEEEEANYRARKASRAGKSHARSQPWGDQVSLYTELDALASLDYFGRNAVYGQRLDLAASIGATFLDAGHILGSASILLELEENGQAQRVLFSGDLGYSGRPIVRDPARPPEADIVVMETTYGDRQHKALQPSVEELYAAISDTFRRGGNVVIPTFALERAQELLFYLREGVASGRLPRSMQIFLDSPMAISATEIYKRHPECYDAETLSLFQGGEDPLHLPGLHFTRQRAESVALNRVDGGAVIMAGSGMCTGGRVRHHLKHNLWRDDSSVIFVSFAARGTLARRIVDGAEKVRIFGEDIRVRARIHTINGFSAHADREGLLAWHRLISGVKRTFLVHGDMEAMTSFSSLLKPADVVIPARHDTYDLRLS